MHLPTRHKHTLIDRRVFRSLSWLWGSLFLYGCTGGLSCDASTPACLNAYEFPQSGLPNGVAPVDDGVRVRMNQAALNVLSENLREIVLSQFSSMQTANGEIAIDVGPFVLNGSNPVVQVGQRTDGSLFPTYAILDANELSERLRFEFFEGVRDGIRIRADEVPFGLKARVFGEWSLVGVSGTASCDLAGTNCPASDPGCGLLSTLSFEMNVFPDVGSGPQCDFGVGECFLLLVELESLSLGDFDASSIEISTPPSDSEGCMSANAPPLCEPECSDTVPLVDGNGDAECWGLCGALDLAASGAAQLGGFLSSTLEDYLDESFEAAIRAALADFDGAPISAADRIEFYEALPDIVNPTTLDLGYYLAPTGNAFDVNCPTGNNCEETRGMDLVLKTGYEAAPPREDDADDTSPPHPCVNSFIGGDFASWFGSSEFFAPDALPLDGEFEGESYHLGSSIARQGINQALFASYNSGVFCFEVDSDSVHRFSEGAFPLTAGTLDLLTEGKLRQFAPPSAPAVLSILPTTPAKLIYGAGTEDDGHASLQIEDIIVSFYVYVYDRYVRVFAVNTDVSAGLTLFADPASETLRLAVVDGPNVENFEEVYNELLPGVNFSDVLGSLVGLAFDALLGDDLAFGYNLTNTLSDSLGVPLYVDFRGLETVPDTGTREFLNFYLSLSSEPPPQPLRSPVPLRFALAEQSGLYHTAAPDVLREGQDPLAPKMGTGRVRLQGVSRMLSSDDEYFAQVDFGMWRGPFKPSHDGVLEIKDPKLRLVGRHTIRLQGRHQGPAEPFQVADDPFELWIDPLKPWVSLHTDDAGVHATGEDIGSAQDDLVYSWRLDDGEWSPFDEANRLSWDEITDVRRLSVQTRDLAGNLSKPSSIRLDVARARLDSRR